MFPGIIGAQSSENYHTFHSVLILQPPRQRAAITANKKNCIVQSVFSPECNCVYVCSASVCEKIKYIAESVELSTAENEIRIKY